MNGASPEVYGAVVFGAGERNPALQELHLTVRGAIARGSGPDLSSPQRFHQMLVSGRWRAFLKGQLLHIINWFATDAQFRFFDRGLSWSTSGLHYKEDLVRLLQENVRQQALMLMRRNAVPNGARQGRARGGRRTHTTTTTTTTSTTTSLSSKHCSDSSSPAHVRPIDLTGRREQVIRRVMEASEYWEDRSPAWGFQRTLAVSLLSSKPHHVVLRCHIPADVARLVRMRLAHVQLRLFDPHYRQHVWVSPHIVKVVVAGRAMDLKPIKEIKNPKLKGRFRPVQALDVSEPSRLLFRTFLNALDQPQNSTVREDMPVAEVERMCRSPSLWENSASSVHMQVTVTACRNEAANFRYEQKGDRSLPASFRGLVALELVRKLSPAELCQGVLAGYKSAQTTTATPFDHPPMPKCPRGMLARAMGDEASTVLGNGPENELLDVFRALARSTVFRGMSRESQMELLVKVTVDLNPQRCDQCERMTNVMRCGVCRTKFYCSRECQCVAWKLHSHECASARAGYLKRRRLIQEKLAVVLKYLASVHEEVPLYAASERPARMIDGVSSTQQQQESKGGGPITTAQPAPAPALPDQQQTSEDAKNASSQASGVVKNTSQEQTQGASASTQASTEMKDQSSGSSQTSSHVSERAVASSQTSTETASGHVSERADASSQDITAEIAHHDGHDGGGKFRQVRMMSSEGGSGMASVSSTDASQETKEASTDSFKEASRDTSAETKETSSTAGSDKTEEAPPSQTAKTPSDASQQTSDAQKGLTSSQQTSDAQKGLTSSQQTSDAQDADSAQPDTPPVNAEATLPETREGDGAQPSDSKVVNAGEIPFPQGYRNLLFGESKTAVDDDILMTDDADVDVEASSTVWSEYSLMCPVSFLRIEDAVRGVHCCHMRPFDLLSFVETSLQAGVWRCPLCYKSTRLEELRVDPIFTQILRVIDEDEEAVMLQEGKDCVFWRSLAEHARVQPQPDPESQPLLRRRRSSRPGANEASPPHAPDASDEGGSGGSGGGVGQREEGGSMVDDVLRDQPSGPVLGATRQRSTRSSSPQRTNDDRRKRRKTGDGSSALSFRTIAGIVPNSLYAFNPSTLMAQAKNVNTRGGAHPYVYMKPSSKWVICRVYPPVSAECAKWLHSEHPQITAPFTPLDPGCTKLTTHQIYQFYGVNPQVDFDYQFAGSESNGSVRESPLTDSPVHSAESKSPRERHNATYRELNGVRMPVLRGRGVARNLYMDDKCMMWAFRMPEGQSLLYEGCLFVPLTQEIRNVLFWRCGYMDLSDRVPTKSTEATVDLEDGASSDSEVMILD